VTFNAGNYSTLQTVTVTGVDDADLNDEVVNVTLHSNQASTPDEIVRVDVTDDGP